MNINDLTIGDAKALAAMFSGATPSNSIDGGNRAVIVRSRDAGVQFGYLQEYAADGSTVTLKNARQMWKWVAAEGGTLLDCAMHGVKSGKFSTKADKVVVIGACAIIDCAAKAEASLANLVSEKWA